jgi:hypothetical protein
MIARYASMPCSYSRRGWWADRQAAGGPRRLTGSMMTFDQRTLELTLGATDLEMRYAKPGYHVSAVPAGKAQLSASHQRRT